LAGLVAAQFMSIYGSRARDRPARAAGAPSGPNRSPRVMSPDTTGPVCATGSTNDPKPGKNGNSGRRLFPKSHLPVFFLANNAAFPPGSRWWRALRSSRPPRSSFRAVDRYGRETEISTIGIRAVPIGEAMVACVIADHYLHQRGQIGDNPA
jgi:hypothetical protein